MPDPPPDRVELVSGGEERFALLALPEQLEEPAPLILDLHGYTEGAGVHAAHTGLAADGVARGFIVVTPHGAGAVPQWPFEPGPEATEFFDDLLDELESTLCIDTNRIFAAGLSNGAIMSSILACESGGRIAAAAPVAGVRTWDGCEIDQGVPVLAFHGTADSFVPYEGGIGDSVANLPGPDGSGSLIEPDELEEIQGEQATEPGVPEFIATWAEANGCDPEPDTVAVSETVDHLDYQCPDEGDVQLYVVNGGGHTWPGSPFLATATDLVGETTFDIDANELMLVFFEANALVS